MSKKRMVGNPWIPPYEAIPSSSARVLIQYSNGEGKEFMCVGWLDPSTGWILHETMRLPDKWKVLFWLPISQPPPF